MKSIQELALSIVSVLALASCGTQTNADKAKLVDACMEIGQSEINCICAADYLEAKLDKRTYKLVSAVIATRGPDSEELLEGLSAEEENKIMDALVSVGKVCMMGGVEG